MARVVPPRDEIPEEFTWDLASVYPSDEVWEEALAAVSERIESLEAFRGHVGDSPHSLLAWLEAQEVIFGDVGKLFVYGLSRHDVDKSDEAGRALFEGGQALFGRVIATVSFGEPEILAIGWDTLQQWIGDEPALAVYGHYFEDLFRRQEHVRSAEVEEVLGLVIEPFMTASDVHSTLADTDLTFKPATSSTGDTIAISQGNYSALLTDADREVRRTAWENYSDAYLSMQNTMATALAAGIKRDVFMARARQYNSSLEAALTPNNIPVEVFYRLIETFKRNLPTWHRYWRVRREALGYDTLHVYDLKAPLATNPPEVSYDQAVEWIVAGMRPLGEEYTEILQHGATVDRWVDIYPNLGKSQGAYSSGWKGTHPFILMSFLDDIASMSTLAHELGHSMHSYYTWETQPMVYTDYSLFVGEVASNFNQALVRAHLLERNPDPDFQIAVIEEAVANNFHRYFFIMPTLARFELEVHERAERGEPLTAEAMTNLMAELFHEGYGDEVAFDHDRIGITWAEFPTHLYANFYVYQYATGIAAAHALAEGVLQGGDAPMRYIEFLKAGGSLYPLEALQRAGVDMTSPDAVDSAFRTLSRMVDRLEQLLGDRAAVGG